MIFVFVVVVIRRLRVEFVLVLSTWPVHDAYLKGKVRVGEFRHKLDKVFPLAISHNPLAMKNQILINVEVATMCLHVNC